MVSPLGFAATGVTPKNPSSFAAANLADSGVSVRGDGDTCSLCSSGLMTKWDSAGLPVLTTKCRIHDDLCSRSSPGKSVLNRCVFGIRVTDGAL
jgi:hypothetical protein